MRDTIPVGRQIVVHQFLPRKLMVRGKAVIVYDMELTLMMIKDWAAAGMTRVDIEDMLLTPPPKLIHGY